MRYPEQLVHEFGAKAGILMYVAQQLPDIPQMPMVVKTPMESLDSFLRRADEANIGWPRLFRSSAVCELDGYEGAFPTHEFESFEQGRKRITNPNYRGPFQDPCWFQDTLRATIERIESSPQELKQEPGHEHLPDKICVIATEKAPSKYVGTFVAHPNQNGFYIATVTDRRSLHTPDKWNATFAKKPGEQISSLCVDIDDADAVASALERMFSWHDQIAALPEMDEGWAYQIEFGVLPDALFQVRPFKQKLVADFRIPENDSGILTVFGVTPHQGIDVCVERDLNENYPLDGKTPENIPSAYIGSLRDAPMLDRLPQLRVNIWDRVWGILAHEDIAAMRRADVTALYPTHDIAIDHIKHGDWINVRSDGRNVQIKKIKR
ncbi:hypothetical protein J4464_05195 [Candidatus Woesearchaeota archaeon]|nr:hypothetical protein [Candidatus Woesearchaeota archaeon]